MRVKLTIIIPVYNGERFLEKCLDSVITCPLEMMECIIVNDGSFDRSLSICENYSKMDSRIQVITIPNNGVSSARNTGLMYAVGDYLLFLDADDYLDETKWELVVEAIESSCDFSAFSYYTLKEDGSTVEELFSIAEENTVSIKEMNRLLLTTPSLNTCWGKILRTEIIRQYNIKFMEGLKTGEDAVFILDYVTHVKNCRIQNSSILYYRQHSASAMHKINIREKLEDLKILYNRRVDTLKRLEEIECEKETYLQFFSVITNLLLEFALTSNECDMRIVYKETCSLDMVIEIVHKTPYQCLSPVYKKIEYQLIRRKLFGLMATYFQWKRKFR